MNSYYLIFLIALVLSGCSPVLKKIYGVKNPDFESHQRILNFQGAIGFENIPYAGLKVERWKEGKIFPVPEVFVFDRHGHHIPYRDSLKPNCNGPAEVFLAELDPHKKYHYSTDFTLTTFLDFLEGPQCQPLMLEQNSNADFFIFITYAVFSGKKIVRKKSALWLDALRKNSKIQYQLVMVNEDLKECWSEEQKKHFQAIDE